MYNQKRIKEIKRLFIALELFLLLITYGFIYTIFIATQLAIEELNVSYIILLPTIFAVFLYPYILYRCKQMYDQGKALSAIGWMTTWSFMIIVILYALLAQLMNIQ